jgi:hypothetical protein
MFSMLFQHVVSASTAPNISETIAQRTTPPPKKKKTRHIAIGPQATSRQTQAAFQVVDLQGFASHLHLAKAQRQAMGQVI